ncbi:MAG: hypothetical protein ABI821_12355 [Pseudomonadota bacterium]
MSSRRGHRHGGSSATVSIHVRDPAQLFNSLDPSPFWDRDLDRDAATFIEEEFAEKRSADVWHLNVHVPDGPASAGDLQQAVENYYGRLASSARRELRDNLRLGELGLLGGIAVFLLCMGLRQLLQGALENMPRILDEGLIILAWLALWRPTEVVAYEWVPHHRKRRLYERLAAIRVSVKSGTPHPQTNIGQPETRR